MTDGEIPWGPTGELVYNRTYARIKPDGSKETWPETVERVVAGNLALVPERYQLEDEREQLTRLMSEFKILPAGRHLWASGVLEKFAGLIKGSTIFPEASFEQAPYERITKQQYETAAAKAVADGVDENCANGACPIK
ncbi:ribonucleotide reductase [Mycobacterium phage AN3]|nr:ribonucleotide reductase [Mycobacterium phage AN3]